MPVTIRLAVTPDLLCRHFQLTGDVLEAVAALIGYDDGLAEPDTRPRSESKRVFLGLLVSLSGFEYFRHVGCHSFMVPRHVCTSPL